MVSSQYHGVVHVVFVRQTDAGKQLQLVYFQILLVELHGVLEKATKLQLEVSLPSPSSLDLAVYSSQFLPIFSQIVHSHLR